VSINWPMLGFCSRDTPLPSAPTKGKSKAAPEGLPKTDKKASRNRSNRIMTKQHSQTAAVPRPPIPSILSDEEGDGLPCL
jgi:hypothetical protein